ISAYKEALHLSVEHHWGQNLRHQKSCSGRKLGSETEPIGRIDMQSTREKFAADSLELKVSIPMFLGQGSRQQADFFLPINGALSRLPLHNFTNCPKQATAQTNDQWCHDNSAHKLSVALVTGFVIFVG